MHGCTLCTQFVYDFYLNYSDYINWTQYICKTFEIIHKKNPYWFATTCIYKNVLKSRPWELGNLCDLLHLFFKMIFVLCSINICIEIMQNKNTCTCIVTANQELKRRNKWMFKLHVLTNELLDWASRVYAMYSKGQARKPEFLEQIYIQMSADMIGHLRKKLVNRRIFYFDRPCNGHILTFSLLFFAFTTSRKHRELRCIAFDRYHIVYRDLLSIPDRRWCISFNFICDRQSWATLSIRGELLVASWCM